MLGGKRSSSLPMYGVTQTQLSTQQLGACAAAVEISGQQKNVGVAPFPLLPSPLLPHFSQGGTAWNRPGPAHEPAHAASRNDCRELRGTCGNMLIYLCMYVYMYVYTYVYMCVYMHMCTYVTF